MALNSSGPISLAGNVTGESIALELSLGATTQISLNDSAVRNLINIVSGQISLSQFYGASALVLKGFYGLNSNNYNVEVLDWSTESVALTGTGYTVNRTLGLGAGSADNKGYWLGGQGTGNIYYNTIDGINYVNYALINTAVGMNTSRAAGASCRSNTTAYYHGGIVSFSTSFIYTSDANTYNMVNNTASAISTSFNNAITSDYGTNQVDNTTHGWFWNGTNTGIPSGYVKRITFSTNSVEDNSVRFGISLPTSNNVPVGFGTCAVRNSTDVWFRSLATSSTSQKPGNASTIAGIGSFSYWMRLLRRFNMSTQSISDVGVQTYGLNSISGGGTSSASAGYIRCLIISGYGSTAYSATSIQLLGGYGMKIEYATQTETLQSQYQITNTQSIASNNTKYN
jgi:hypothetical protein